MVLVDQVTGDFQYPCPDEQLIASELRLFRRMSGHLYCKWFGVGRGVSALFHL